MPEVPAARQSQFRVVQGGPPQVEPKFLAMSAAMMHAQGRLFNPPETVQPGTKDDLKQEEKAMEEEQSLSDFTTNENAKRKVKEQAI